jgi:type II secretory pathway predicted ATPase ExeA
VAIRSALAPLDAAETRRLIDHRVAVAGREAPLFTPEAYDLIQRLSGGLPRRVNQIAWNALPIAFGRRETTISAQSVREAGLTGLGIEELQYA